MNAKEEWPDSGFVPYGFVIIDEVDGFAKKQDEQDKFQHRLRSWLETDQKRRLILVGGEESIEISASQQSPFNLSTAIMMTNYTLEQARGIFHEMAADWGCEEIPLDVIHKLQENREMT